MVNYVLVVGVILLLIGIGLIVASATLKPAGTDSESKKSLARITGILTLIAGVGLTFLGYNSR